MADFNIDALVEEATAGEDTSVTANVVITSGDGAKGKGGSGN